LAALPLDAMAGEHKEHRLFRNGCRLWHHFLLVEASLTLRLSIDAAYLLLPSAAINAPPRK
jgi:hypothetical protein